ncbi:MAG TPA: hypothetical protein VLE97_11260 [Gaiellaceae bacterium]|nr:hypothetical protein [Gaiellaceae bacterium]
MALSEVVLFRSIVVRLSDDLGSTFAGYTDDQRWHGLVYPHLPLNELLRVLDVLLERGGGGKPYTVIDDRQIRVHGVVGVADDFVLKAKLQATPDGDLWLFDCGGMWRFTEVPNQEGN